MVRHYILKRVGVEEMLKDLLKWDKAQLPGAMNQELEYPLQPPFAVTFESPDLGTFKR